MSIKNKLRAGFGFLFLIALVCCGLSIYFLNELSSDASVILKDNYESVEFARNINAALDQNQSVLNKSQLNIIETNLYKQERNVTEPGEQQLTDSLRSKYEQLKKAGIDKQADLRIKLRNINYGIMQVNMAAIEHKNAIAKDTASRGTLFVALIGTFCFLVAFSFVVNFPGYIANPLKELTGHIKEISNKNYHQQIDFGANDEFGELGQAFNTMTRKLDEFENSNLSNILFEKKRIETIINSMHDAIIGLDEKSTIIFANQVACSLLGMPEEKLIGNNAPEVALENDLLRNLLVNDQLKMKIYADNRESFYTKEILPVSSDDKVIGKVIILKNITEYQQLDEAKTNFIATISHELKTPISSIKMSLKLLDDVRVGEVNIEQKQLIANIDEDTRRLMHITTELLDMAQVETGKIKLNFGSTHPKNIVDYAVKAVKFIADQSHIVIKIKCDDSLPYVRADLDKTTWVLINLLSNAIKYSRPNTTVELNVKQHKAGTIEFVVQDHGQGIEDKYLLRIFERYFKVPGTSLEQSGTGLGLAIAKDFIEAQSGMIGVNSEIGVGSKFYFILPMG